MESSRFEDDLILRLDQAAEGTPDDSTLAGFLAELETLITDVRQPAAPDPYVTELELGQALDLVQEMAKSPPPETEAELPEPVGISLGRPISLGQYQLLAELGTGGMGTVYKALHTRLDRMVALKVLPTGKIPSREMLARFDREMRAAGKLQHPHIVAAQDAGEVDGTHFLAMELVEGRDLSVLVKQVGPFRIADACEVVRQAAIGLQHISDSGMVHRDIKPSNLMLARPRHPADIPVVKILDLGLALFQSGPSASAELTTTGQVLGTLDYMAPEQGLDSSQPLDIRADIYSLGATLFKLLTGRAPFEDSKRGNTMQRLRALEQDTPPTLSELRPDCPVELSELVARLLAKSPSERPAQPDDVAKLLTPFAAGADLRALLAQAAAPRHQSAEVSLSKTMTPASTAPFSASSQAGTIAPTLSEKPSKRSPQFLTPTRIKVFASLAAAALVLAIFLVMNEQGTVSIEVPDELVEHVSVTLLRNGMPVDTDWQIKARINERRLRTGRVEVRIPADLAQEFELQTPDEMIVRRGKTVALKLTRRLHEPQVASSHHKPADALPTKASEPPFQIVEPPPLEDWLKGRTMLTVAKDGSGQFQTIQAALNAVQSGQVVKVLDKGPYHERLVLDSPPPDIGLISEVQTRIEFLKFADLADMGRVGHSLIFLDRFRIHGFEFVIPLTPEGNAHRGGIYFWKPRSVVLENCAVHRPFENPDNLTIQFSKVRGSPDEPNVIRECYIENRVQVYDSHSPDGSVAILRNFFTGELALEIGCIFKLCIVRNNIFSGTLKGSCGNHVVHADWFEFTNNTLLSIPNALSIETVAARRLHESRIQEHRREQAFQPKFDQGHAPTGQGAIYNNLHHRPGLVFVWDDGAKDLWSWQIGYNCYPGSGDFPIENTMPRPTNTLAMPVFYSLLPQEPNYARLKPDSPGATTGAGGDWPSYTGALPPGPAPKNGDWFTRLMERWGGVQPTKTGEPQEEIAGSVQIEEPPPLEEWLKGRKILTVAQDGSGQFKTIQAALDALQVGEVVQVLDRGPYREQLNSHRFPSDSGLISKVRTIIELPQATILDDGRSAGHRFVIPDRFRLHGLAFQFPAIEKGLGLVCGGDDGLVIEQCQFRITNNPFDGSSTVYLHSGPKGLSNPTVVRDCRFDGRLMVNGDPNPFDRDVLILRNYFTAYDGEKTPLGVIHAFRTLVIRENVIKGGAVSFSTLEGSQSIDVSRNTFVGDMTLNVFGSLPEHVSFDRNLFSDYGQIAVTKTLPTHRINRWQMTLNYSQGRTVDWEGTIRAPQGPTDRVMPFRFLSKLPDNRDYLRLPIPREGDENSVPDGIGALPAGPRPPEGDWFSRLQESWFEIKDEPSPR